jgi:carboxymethylenebutenolidase
MCYNHDAVPPSPPVGQLPYAATDLVLRASDGTEFAAFEAVPQSPASSRILLLPDIGGLSDFYRRLGGYLAGVGYRTLVIDWFGRTAGPALRTGGLDHDEWQFALTREELLIDVQTGLDNLVGNGPLVAMGFCIGGGTALHAAAQGLAIDSVVAFYPFTGGWVGVPALPDDFVAAIDCPVLGLFGAADEAVPVAKAHAFRTLLAPPSEVVIYDGEPHGYFEKDFRAEGGHEEASVDSWSRLLAFLGGSGGPKTR